MLLSTSFVTSVIIASSSSSKLAVTLVTHAKAVQDVEICFAPYSKAMLLDSWRQIFPSRIEKHSLVEGENWTSNIPYLGNGARWGIIHTTKSHTFFLYVPKLVILNDPQRRNGRYFCVSLFHRNWDLEPITSRWLKLNPHCLRQECSPKEYSCRQYMIYSDILRNDGEKCVRQVSHTRQRKFECARLRGFVSNSYVIVIDDAVSFYILQLINSSK